ncbi:hypothetical protein KV205_13640 [Streptomyces sp. SKN60]|uniref:hypothetical protein n=1 Tax=Streptomyces sp. SKN60 TaxID=2855506 RepID=UPI002247E3F5|nr:hypothetical protein [Streptomyces sp. SKN60]MCX2181568.1 hypothetical protein [Streptomyces sp. SKN60]
MKHDRRLRPLAVDGTPWLWTVRQRLRPVYEDCRLTLAFHPADRPRRERRRLAIVFAPTDTGVISNDWFESGTVIRLADQHHLNLYEPGTARRLLEAAQGVLGRAVPERDTELDGWPLAWPVMDATDYPAAASRSSA